MYMSGKSSSDKKFQVKIKFLDKKFGGMKIAS